MPYAAAVRPVALPRPTRPSRRTATLTLEGAFDVAARVRALRAAGREIADLSIGEPSFATPLHIVEAGIRALRDGETRYTPIAGIEPLRVAIAASLHRRGIADAHPDNVIVTPGAKGALFYALQATLDPGDEVLIPDPGFPAYASVAAFTGAEIRRYRALDASGAVEGIVNAITARTRVVVLNSPANPSGLTYSHNQIAAIGDAVAGYDITVISDECYGNLLHDDRISAPSIAALPGFADRTIVVDSFSKSYAMTGWRLGFALVPESLRRTVLRLAVNGHSCVPGFVQRAGIAALTGSQGAVRRMRQELRGRRDTLVGTLASLPGVSCAPPDGAFYAFADVSRAAARAGRSTDAFADWLLDRGSVAGVAGTAFGAGGEGRVRFSFAASPDQLALAVEALRALFEGGLS